MPFRLHPQGLTVQIRLTPKARKNAIGGLKDVGDGSKALQVAVNAPPEDGKANKALLTLLADEWDLPKSSLSLLSGDTNRQKVVLIVGDGGKLQERIEPTIQK